VSQGPSGDRPAAAGRPEPPGASGAFAGVGVLTSVRAHGDFALAAGPGERAARQRALVDLPWVEVDQVHGAGVVEVRHGGGAAVAGTGADALVTPDAGVVLAVRTGDCAPVVLAGSRGGPVGVAHAGWRGVEAGVVEATVAALRRLGAESVAARIGPCIEGACYEFGAADLDRLAERYGSVVRCMTKWGTPGLSVVAAVTAACARVGVPVVGEPPPCTACGADRFWSHRARGESGRMVTAVWRPAPAP
jgi:YfiH family protein